jgi:hypothetical protein
MAAHFRTFVDFVLAFGVRWFVAMSVLLGVPLTFESYFVSGSVAKFLFFFCGVGCLIFSSFWTWKVERQARRKAEALVLHKLIDAEHSFLFLEPSARETWSASITPAMTVANVRVCLDVSAHSGGMGLNTWSTKRRLVLREDIRFVTGAAVSICLMEHDNGGKEQFWRWAGEGNPRVSFTSQRCQLVFAAERGPSDYFDFVVEFSLKPPPLRDLRTPMPYEKTPSLIGEHMFLYSREWKKDGVSQ